MVMDEKGGWVTEEGEKKDGAEVISFEDASHPHVHARKEDKLKKVQAAFRAATREKLKADRIAKRKKKNSRNKKKKKR